MQERAIEKHIQTVFMAVTLASIFWVGNTLVGQGISQTKTDGNINLIKAEQEYMKTLIEKLNSNNYTMASARRRSTDVNKRFILIEKRLLELERK